MVATHYTALEALTHDTFIALMNALSFPGRVFTLPTSNTDESFRAIADTLLDIETSYYTPDMEWMPYLERSGSHAQPPDQAAYWFVSNRLELDLLQQASVGTMLNPQEACTLILGCQMSAGQTTIWQGPGILSTITVQLAGIPEPFWKMRQQMIHYPMGWDAFFVEGNRVIGLPRTTLVEE
ncbi:MAG: phosphonate C-P lyase system protein PhnH [Phototrophicaceae bacterium]